MTVYTLPWGGMKESYVPSSIVGNQSVRPETDKSRNSRVSMFSR